MGDSLFVFGEVSAFGVIKELNEETDLIVAGTSRVFGEGFFEVLEGHGHDRLFQSGSSGAEEEVAEVLNPVVAASTVCFVGNHLLGDLGYGGVPDGSDAFEVSLDKAWDIAAGEKFVGLGKVGDGFFQTDPDVGQHSLCAIELVEIGDVGGGSFDPAGSEISEDATGFGFSGRVVAKVFSDALSALPID